MKASGKRYRQKFSQAGSALFFSFCLMAFSVENTSATSCTCTNVSCTCTDGSAIFFSGDLGDVDVNIDQDITLSGDMCVLINNQGTGGTSVTLDAALSTVEDNDTIADGGIFVLNDNGVGINNIHVTQNGSIVSADHGIYLRSNYGDTTNSIIIDYDPSKLNTCGSIILENSYAGGSETNTNYIEVNSEVSNITLINNYGSAKSNTVIVGATGKIINSYANGGLALTFDNIGDSGGINYIKVDGEVEAFRGVVLISTSAASNIIEINGSVTTKNYDAVYLRDDSPLNSSVNRIVINGSVSNSANYSLVISKVNGPSDIIVNSTASILSGGRAIWDEGTTGTVNVWSNGIIKGNLILNAYDDTVQVTGGKLTGNIYADAMEVQYSAASDNDGDDTISISGGEVSGMIIGGGGNDVISISSAADVQGDIYGDYRSNSLYFGQDTVTVSGGAYSGSMYMGADDDKVQISGGTVEADIYGQDGSDMLTFSGGSVTGTIYGGEGADAITVSGGNVYGDIYGDDNNSATNGGNDTFNVKSGMVDGDLYGEGGDDAFNVQGGTVNGTLYGGDGDDELVWSGGNIEAFRGESGDDTAFVSAGNYDGTQLLDGGPGNDTVTFSSINASAPGANIVDWETANLAGTSLTITDGLWTVGDGSDGTGVFLTGGSSLDGLDALALDANLDIDSTSTFEASGNGTGLYTIAYDLTNNGRVNMADGYAGDRVAVNRDYSGSGVLTSDVDFNTGASDSMLVAGNLSANGTIKINDITVNEGSFNDDILLVQADIDSNKDDEAFVLADDGHRYNGQSNLGRWKGSPFIWKLKTSGNNWVLGDAIEAPVEETDLPANPTEIPTVEEESEVVAASPVATPVAASSGTDNSAAHTASQTAVVSEIPAYLGLPTFSYEVIVNKLDTLHQRLGELRNHNGWATIEPAAMQLTQGANPPVSFDDTAINGWIRSTYSGFSFDADNNFQMEGNFGILEMGFDRKLSLNEHNSLYTGVYGSYIDGDFSNDGSGKTYGTLYEADTDMSGWSLGAYATWFNTDGNYVDLVLDYMSLDADITAVDHFSTDGTVLGGSAEIGKSIVYRPKMIIEPQVQVKVANVEWNGFFDGWNDVSFDDHTYVTGRAGIRSEYTKGLNNGGELKPWLYIGVQHEFTDAPDVNYVVDFESQQYGTTGNIQLGLTYDVTGSVQLYGDMGYTTDVSGYDSYRVDAGVRVRW